MNSPYPAEWTCPKCACSGLNNVIRPRQFNSKEALYMCEGKGCLYPMDVLKKIPILKRKVCDMPVTEQILQFLGLPSSLLNETGLTESHLNNLVLLKSLKLHEKKILETKEAWESFVKRVESEGQDLPTENKFYRDADFDKLKIIQPSNPFVRHILPDVDDNF